MIRQQVIAQRIGLRMSQIEMLIGAPLAFLFRSREANRPTPARPAKNIAEGKRRGERKRMARVLSDARVTFDNARGHALGHRPASAR